MNWTPEDIDIMEDWWIQKSRVNFLAYRMFVRHGILKTNWFVDDLCKHLQQFYVDLKAGKRPIILIQSPPQHGKSWSVADFITWISGMDPELRSIYATYSEKLGIRCNLAQQRMIDSPKYKKIFPDTNLSQKKGEAVRNTSQLEFLNKEGEVQIGSFRNTTVAGSVTGESLDVGIIDDSVKGREQANSIGYSQKIWDWFLDDFGTRFSDAAGLLIIMTRWTTHDIIGRMLETGKEVKVVNYQAIATKDEVHRDEGEALFPELKSLEFLEGKKKLMAQSSWESLYQGSPTIQGGNKVKDHWWKWWKVLPRLKQKFITADNSQKARDEHDWDVFQLWGEGVDGDLYLLDKKRGKWEAPELRVEAEIFYKKHNTPRINLTDPVLRGMYIEDKSAGTTLIQELQRISGLNIFEIPRIIDKNMRADDASPFIESGRIHLNTDIPDVDNLTKEAREFPNSEFDDDFDTLMTAIEITYINQEQGNMLEAAMEAV